MAVMDALGGIGIEANGCKWMERGVEIGVSV